MGLMPLAFSIHNFISSVGADAGFAAIIGLAILVLLYFVHARETANLREEAAMLAARLQQAEARVAELSRPQPVAVPAAETVQVTDRRGTIAAPFAPAGMAAPALAAATRVVPLPEVAAESEAPGQPEPAVAMAGAPVAAASPSVVPGAPGVASAPPSVTPQLPERAPGQMIPRPSPPATAIPRPATAAGANGGGRGSAPTPPSARGAAAGPGAYSPRALPPLGSPVSSGRSRGRRVVIGLVALLVVAAVAVGLVVITSGTGNTGHSTAGTPTTNAPAAKHATVFTPSSVTVAVLNGTSTNRLAHRVAAKLVAEGYKPGNIATAANQTEPTTIVAYLPGAQNRTDARHVATALNLQATAVKPIDQGTEQVACPPPGACNADVVVVVGADLATL